VRRRRGGTGPGAAGAKNASGTAPSRRQPGQPPGPGAAARRSWRYWADVRRAPGHRPRGGRPLARGAGHSDPATFASDTGLPRRRGAARHLFSDAPRVEQSTHTHTNTHLSPAPDATPATSQREAPNAPRAAAEARWVRVLRSGRAQGPAGAPTAGGGGGLPTPAGRPARPGCPARRRGSGFGVGVSPRGLGGRRGGPWCPAVPVGGRRSRARAACRRRRSAPAARRPPRPPPPGSAMASGFIAICPQKSVCLGADRHLHREE
jgi:hypothetical protein